MKEPTQIEITDEELQNYIDNNKDYRTRNIEQLETTDIQTLAVIINNILYIKYPKNIHKQSKQQRSAYDTHYIQKRNSREAVKNAYLEILNKKVFTLNLTTIVKLANRSTNTVKSVLLEIIKDYKLEYNCKDMCKHLHDILHVETTQTINMVSI